MLSFEIICSFDSIFIIGNSINHLFYLKNLVNIFLVTKGIDCHNNSYFMRSFLNNFDIQGYKFFISPYRFLFSVVNSDLQKIYKIKLKNLIKSSYNISIVKLIKLLNIEINFWKQFYNFQDSARTVSYELDIYLYKLLWKFIKRYHPRRTNSWLYDKYWRCFSGIWRFSFYDSISGNVCFLNFHYSLKRENSYLPLLMNIFEAKNYRKLFCVLFHKSLPNFKGLNRLLFIKQKGLCNICFKQLNVFNFKLIKSSNNNIIVTNKYLHCFCLIHSYCKY
jgi:RNA-directed DNA polymerase